MAKRKKRMSRPRKPTGKAALKGIVTVTKLAFGRPGRRKKRRRIPLPRRTR